MNSAHEQCPNSDPKQYTFTKLGCVHNAHTQKPGRAHTTRAVPRSWALLRAQPTSRAHVTRIVSAGRALGGRALVVTHPGSLSQVAARMSQPQNDVATRIFPTAGGPCRDIKITSRRPQGQTGSRLENGVATPFLLPSPKPGRNTKNPGRDLLETTLCRDINFMSRPRLCLQWDFQVTTPKIQVATSPTATHVVTSKMMSRPQISSAPSLLRCDAIFPCRDLPCCQPCRDLKNDVATSSCPSKLPTLSQPQNSRLQHSQD